MMYWNTDKLHLKVTKDKTYQAIVKLFLIRMNKFLTCDLIWELKIEWWDVNLLFRESLFHWETHRTIHSNSFRLGWFGQESESRRDLRKPPFTEFLIFIVLSSLLMTNGFRYPMEINTRNQNWFRREFTCINIAHLDSDRTRHCWKIWNSLHLSTDFKHH